MYINENINFSFKISKSFRVFFVCKMHDFQSNLTHPVKNLTKYMKSIIQLLDHLQGWSSSSIVEVYFDWAKNVPARTFSYLSAIRHLYIEYLIRYEHLYEIGFICACGNDRFFFSLFNSQFYRAAKIKRPDEYRENSERHRR